MKSILFAENHKWGATLILFAFVLAAPAHAQEYKKIKRLGTSQAVCKGGVDSVEELQTFVKNNKSSFRSILNNSGWSGSADDVLEAIENGDLSQTSYPVGTQFHWMGAHKNGGYIVHRNREWAGSSSIDAFKLNVSSGCQVYEMAIPKICCNISLVGVSQDQSDDCQQKEVAAPVAPAPAGQPAPEAPKAAKAAATLFPFIAAFAGSETRPRYEPAWDMDMKDSSGIAGVRAGIMKALSPETHIFSQLSWYDRDGINEFNVYSEDNLAVDVGIEHRLSEKAFIGGGFGIWNIDDSEYRDATLFGHVGGDIGSSNFQWFLEGRVFGSDSENHDSISDNKMFSAGIRYLIK